MLHCFGMYLAAFLQVIEFWWFSLCILFFLWNLAFWDLCSLGCTLQTCVTSYESAEKPSQASCKEWMTVRFREIILHFSALCMCFCDSQLKSDIGNEELLTVEMRSLGSLQSNKVEGHFCMHRRCCLPSVHSILNC